VGSQEIYHGILFKSETCRHGLLNEQSKEKKRWI